MSVERLHFAKSDIGRRRPQNEDCFVADPSLGLYVVCDGMGGGNAGEVASRMIMSPATHCATVNGKDASPAFTHAHIVKPTRRWL